MNWILLLVVVFVFLGIIMKLKAGGTLPAATAREHLKKGAMLVDVRTVAEYRAGHLPHAFNIPLDQVQQEFPRRAPDKSKVVLLHCRSGQRSGIAERELRALGYTNVFNLGGYGRAEEAVNGRSK